MNRASRSHVFRLTWFRKTKARRANTDSYRHGVLSRWIQVKC